MTTHYVYGPGGMLYGEYDSSGALIREYIYVNGAPVAQIDAGSPESILYLHTDHLLTPRYATDGTGATVWSWDSGAFGAEAPTGSATVNLRFPGQYYDSETGFHYNWHRYYDPETGRYITSDPLGLAAGLNSYGYAGQNPLLFIDPDGAIPIAVLLPVLGHILTWGGGSFIGGVIYADLINAVQCDITWNQFWRNTAWHAITAGIGFGVGKALGWLGAAIGKGLGGRAGRFFDDYINDISGSVPPTVRPKSVNLPSAKKVKIDMEEVSSGHMPGGKRLAPGNKKSLFPENMTESQVERAIREAYANGKRIKMQGPRVKVRGTSDEGIEIDIWVNTETNIIESAWPTGR